MNEPTAATVVQVAAAVIVDGGGRVLLARRAPHRHQGGLWEFPGGKIEPHETARAALARELYEEVGIVVESARPLIRLRHAYPGKTVLLDVWRVTAFHGEPHGREGQPVEWVAVEELTARDFPAANPPIITAARLPPVYLVTPEPSDDDVFWSRLEAALEAGVRLVQFRAKQLNAQIQWRLARRAIELCRAAGARLLLNAPPAWAEELGAAGVHLTSARLRALAERPLGREYWVAASCHTQEELRHAQAIGVDFAVVAPVLPTASHPAASPLGWPGLRDLTEAAVMPVYALGGMSLDAAPVAFEHGAQGIAAISSLWAAAANPVTLAARLRQLESD